MIPPKVRAVVTGRDGARCIRCGTATTQLHHRLPRGRGGGNTPANLVPLCGSGNSGCHGEVESFRKWAYERGLLVRTNVDPATVPVVTRAGPRYLTDDGRWTRTLEVS